MEVVDGSITLSAVDGRPDPCLHIAACFLNCTLHLVTKGKIGSNGG